MLIETQYRTRRERDEIEIVSFLGFRSIPFFFVLLLFPISSWKSSVWSNFFMEFEIVTTSQPHEIMVATKLITWCRKLFCLGESVCGNSAQQRGHWTCSGGIHRPSFRHKISHSAHKERNSSSPLPPEPTDACEFHIIRTWAMDIPQEHTQCGQRIGTSCSGKNTRWDSSLLRIHHSNIPRFRLPQRNSDPKNEHRTCFLLGAVELRICSPKRSCCSSHRGIQTPCCCFGHSHDMFDSPCCTVQETANAGGLDAWIAWLGSERIVCRAWSDILRSGRRSSHGRTADKHYTGIRHLGLEWGSKDVGEASANSLLANQHRFCGERDRSSHNRNMA